MAATDSSSLLWPGRNGPNLGYITAPPDADFLALRRRRLAILGSTGSIGSNAVHIAANARDRLAVVALACGKNISRLAIQADQLRPRWLCCATESLAAELHKLLPKGYHPEILYGPDGYENIARLESADLVLSAQAGSTGLEATLGAAQAGKVIALANKESLVLAGGLIRKICASSGSAILPVDSEHFAIFQCAGGRGQNIATLILTASGGPFLNRSRAEMDTATAEQALRHPTWSMGRKISIDSATMMNKGLELIEAMHLFGVEPGQIRILIHPQSIVHSLVELTDNSQIAQLAVPDMRLAIAGSLLWPEPGRAFIQRLDLANVASLTFLEPDLQKFACLALALQAATTETGCAWRALGLNPACIALSSANETAVNRFLAGKCRLGDIAELARLATGPWFAVDAPKPDPGVSAAATIHAIAADAARTVASALASRHN